MIRSSSYKEDDVSLRDASFWDYKNVSEAASIQKKLQKQLASDILCLFEESKFVDLKLVLPNGCVYSHKVIISCRFPPFWKLLSDISCIQTWKCTGGIFTVFLPKINIEDFKSFIRSLYTNEVNKIAWIAVRVCLKKHLFVLNQKYKNHRLYLEKLNSEEELELQNTLLCQLRKGEISEAKGNLRDVTHLVAAELTCPIRSRQRTPDDLTKCHSKTGTVAEKNSPCSSSLHSSRNSFLHKQREISKIQCDIPQKGIVVSAMNSENPLKSNTKPLGKELSKFIPNSAPGDVEESSNISFPVISRNNIALEKSDIQALGDEVCPNYSLKSSVQPESECDLISLNVNHLSKSASGSLPETEPQGRKREGLRSSKTFSGIFSSPHRAKQSSHYPSVLGDGLQAKEKIAFSSNLNDLDRNSFQKDDFCNSRKSSSPRCQPDDGDNIANSLVYEEENESQISDINTQKPLVRTKTFSLSESLPSSAIYTKENESIDNNLENNVAVDEHPSLFDKNVLSKNKETSFQEDPLKMRELERKKGSLIFEHNFQTFSNIPPTNMMSVSLDSDSSIRLISLYNKMKENVVLNSIPSSTGNEDSFPSPSFMSLYEKERFSNQRPPQLSASQSSQEELSKKNISDTRSPSPDSLCADQPPIGAEGEKNSLSKEDLNIEEKEKDDKESTGTLKSNYNSSQENNADDSITYDEKQATSDVNSCDIGGPRLNHKDDSKPIVSGGSTLRKDSLKNIKEESYPKRTQRQISSGSVKDFDDIPLVCGYISPEREEQQQESTKKQQSDRSQHSQSMFSMFIDLDQIPAAENDTPDPPKPKLQASGGMYMFIEADNLSSPKTKRRIKNEAKSGKDFRLPGQPEVNQASKIEGLPSESTVINIKTKDVEDVACKQSPREEIRSVKKGFFTFIETENSSKENSPKPKRRHPIHRKFSKPQPNVMSKSAPSDCLLFSREDSSKTSSSTESSSKLMTKSVIDREEFMAQPPTRRNVSLSDKINESSRIPRPISSLKKLALENTKNAPSSQIASAHKLSTIKKKGRDQGHSRLEDLQVSVSEATPPANGFGLTSSLTADAEDTSDFSDISSLLSSIDRSNELSDQDGKESHNALGNDLLKMFLNEINTDVVVQIGEKKIKAHKCILASRCAYFAAMLSGHWVESAGNVIKLQGFSPETVMVALRHIYSGSSAVPDGMDVKELAALADMLALDGLKDVVALHLKAEACHYFHKPCPECVKGVLEVLPIASTFCLEDLYHKCLKWIAKHFATVIPTRMFSALPTELEERCLKQIVDDMSINNVIDTVLGGDQIISILPVVRWAQPIFDLTAQLLESATNFVAANFSRVLASDKFQSLGHDDGRCIDNLEDSLKVACELIRPDQAVLSHIQLTKLSESILDENGDEFSETFLGMISRLLRQVEKFIIHNANRVAVCRKWPLLPPETQKRIKDAALVVVEFSKPSISRQKFSSSTTVRRRGNSIEPAYRQRTNSLSDHRLSRSASANVVPPRTYAPTTKRLQLMPGRCHTPPLPTGSRAPPLQTPPPTRASTLRAQARQAAIQRSQSARTVAERPKRLKPAASDVSTENDSSSNSGCAKGTFTRSRTSSQGSFSTFSGTSRSSTPGISDRTKHKRNASVPHLVAVNRAFHVEEEILQRKSIILQRPSEKLHEKSGSKLLFRSHTPEVQPKPLQLQSSSMGSLREFSPRDQKKHLEVAKATKSRPAMGRRLRSPLRENNRVNAIVSHALPRVASVTTKDWKDEGAKKAEPVGLGSRSNTFCKDDHPPPSSEVDKTESVSPC